ncbi:MAG: hypothetical protein JOZ57_11760 [Abitibacteriaceae bacterium]|nr:hypothetical protein [Abditibacteriaceae bacterium]
MQRSMPHAARLVGLVALSVIPIVHPQNILSSCALAATVTASTVASDYRLTKHTLSTGGRGGHSVTYYRFDPYLDQATTRALSLPLGRSKRVTAIGTFFSPPYAATVTASTALTNTPSLAVFTVRYSGTTTVRTPLSAHQSVVATAQPGGTFTLTRDANVSVSTAGYTGGVFRLFGNGVDVLLGPLSGTSGRVALDTPLTAGTYGVASRLTYTSNLDTQFGTAMHPGLTSATWGFTMTITPSEPDSLPGAGLAGSGNS